MAEKKNPAGLVGLLFVLAMLVVALVVDRRGRAEAEEAAARLELLMGTEAIPSNIITPQVGTPTAEEVSRTIGKAADGPMAPSKSGAYEAYSFGKLRKYHLYVYYDNATKPRIVRMSLFKKLP